MNIWLILYFMIYNIHQRWQIREIGWCHHPNNTYQGLSLTGPPLGTNCPFWSQWPKERHLPFCLDLSPPFCRLKRRLYFIMWKWRRWDRISRRRCFWRRWSSWRKQKVRHLKLCRNWWRGIFLRGWQSPLCPYDLKGPNSAKHQPYVPTIYCFTLLL